MDKRKDKFLESRVLTTKEAADHLGVSERTLIRWRVSRTGPAWTYAGKKVRYLQEDLESYVKGRRHDPERGEQ